MSVGIGFLVLIVVAVIVVGLFPGKNAGKTVGTGVNKITSGPGGLLKRAAN